MDPIIIVGAGMAGYSVARELRKLDRESPMIIVTGDGGGFYSKPMLSNAFAQNKAAAQLVTQDVTQMAGQLNATILPSTRVTGIDTAAQRLQTSAGEFGYRALVLAVGAQPIRIPIEGDGAADVLSVNHIDDYAAFRSRLGAGSRVTILGAGLIGCEFADDLAGGGHRVSLVDPNPRALGALAPQDIGDALGAALQARGVRLELNTTAAKIMRTDDGLDVILASGVSLISDVVLSAVGLRPDIALAQAAGLAVNRGILVDAEGRTSATGVFALGDCAEYSLPTGASQAMPYIAPLLHAARAIAKSLSGEASRIDHRPAPVIVKTPSLPIALLPPAPAIARSGSWTTTMQGEQIICRFYDPDGVMQGFALAPQDAAQRTKLLAEIGSRSAEAAA